MKRIIFFLVVLSISFLSCHKDNDSVPALSGIEYFPTVIGSYKIYDVHLIVYSNDTIDSTFQMKELIQDTFYYNNTVVYELYRFYRSDNTQPWPDQPDSVWTFTTDRNQITIQEASVDFIRLVFPLSNGKVWDGNTRNTYLRDDYTAATYASPYTIGSVYFPQTTTIVEEKSKNLVYKDYRNRVYAKDVGMIFKHAEYIAYNTSPSLIGQDIIDYGSIREETLVEYGKP